MTKSTIDIKLDNTAIKAIETVLAKGQRVELIPVKDGVKVVKVTRDTIINVAKEQGEEKQSTFHSNEFHLYNRADSLYRVDIEIKETGQKTHAVMIEQHINSHLPLARMMDKENAKSKIVRDIYADEAIIDAESDFLTVIQTNKNGTKCEYKAYKSDLFDNHLIEV